MNFLLRITVGIGCLVMISPGVNAADDHHDHHDREHTTPPTTQQSVRGDAAPGDGDDHKHDEDHVPGEDSHTDEVKLTAEAVKSSGITLGKVTKQKLRRTVVVPARVGYDTEAMAHVGSPVVGRAVRINIRVGDSVKKGDPLVVVESSELGEAQSDYIQKRTAAALAAATVEPAKNSYARAKTLYEQSQGIALNELQRREVEVTSATAALRTAQAAVFGAESKLRLLGMKQADTETLIKSGQIDPNYVVSAPIDGQVIKREVTLGELVSPDKETLLTLANTERVWVLADVPEAMVNAIAVKANASVLTVATTQPIEGIVTHLAPHLDAATRTAQARIELPNTGGQLRPGMFAKAEIATAETDAAEVLVVPESALTTLEGGQVVFIPVDGEENTFAARKVTTGKPVSRMVPVTSGLEEGDAVVVTGVFILKADLGKSGAAHEH